MSAMADDWLSANIRRLEAALYLERRAHSATKLKLKKADHDRLRYARRIELLQSQRDVISRELAAIRDERDILRTCVETLEGKNDYGKD